MFGILHAILSNKNSSIPLKKLSGEPPLSPSLCHFFGGKGGDFEKLSKGGWVNKNCWFAIPFCAIARENNYRNNGHYFLPAHSVILYVICHVNHFIYTSKYWIWSTGLYRRSFWRTFLRVTQWLIGRVSASHPEGPQFESWDWRNVGGGKMF